MTVGNGAVMSASSQRRSTLPSVELVAFAKPYISRRMARTFISDPRGQSPAAVLRQPQRNLSVTWGGDGMLFLSYAEEDSEIAARIARWFNERGIRIFNWLDPRQRGGQFLWQIEEAIRRADAFLALLSPSFLASPWCRRERHLALVREHNLQLADGDRAFIHVLAVAKTPVTDTGFMGTYDWSDLAESDDIEAVLTQVIGRMGTMFTNGPKDVGESMLDNQPADEDGSTSTALNYNIQFRNRLAELEQIMGGLFNSAGPHFWLVTAPPQLGKSWFLRHLSHNISSEGWTTRAIDLRNEPPEVRTSVPSILRRIFSLADLSAIDHETNVQVAQQITRLAGPLLCTLDGAELLDRSTASMLKSCLCDIYQLVRNTSMKDRRLAVVIASRSDDNWHGLKPRISVLPLTEFTVDVVRDSLYDLADSMGISHFAVDMGQVATTVHRATEGLPALLLRCLQWIQDEQWIDLRRLDSQKEFEGLAEPYISDGLLSVDSILPASGQTVDDPATEVSKRESNALRQAYRVLAPYRLFTQSHLRHHLGSDETFADALAARGWSLEDLSMAISDAALLKRPLNEPWQETHPAIRRLLYRYFYRDNSDRCQVHAAAGEFVKVWGRDLLGKEQVVCMVECLYHQAMALNGTEPVEFERILIALTISMRDELRPSSYTVDELRHYGVDRMTDDSELEDAVNRVDGLFARLIEIVQMP
jgi:hypothetical protein